MESSPNPKDEGRQEEKARDAVTPEHHHRGKKARAFRPSETVKILLLIGLTVLAIALFIGLPYRWLGARYVAAQWERMRILFGEPTLLIIHLTTYLIVLVIPWLLQFKKETKVPVKMLIKVFAYVLVVMVLIANTWNVTTATRHLVAQRAAEMSDESVTYVHSQLGSSPRATCDLVILDQGIAKVMSYLHVIVRNEFPEFDLRTASLHMVPTGKHSSEVWDIIQEGSQRKDREFMNYPADSNSNNTSLVGQTIKQGKVKYCKDIINPQQGGDDCNTFQNPGSGDPEYKSLLCFPLQRGLSTPVFASICFDSYVDHAFDEKEDVLKKRIKNQMNQLSELLELYRNQDRSIFQDSQPGSQPAAAAR
jgi:hypothetical protein